MERAGGKAKVQHHVGNRRRQAPARNTARILISLTAAVSLLTVAATAVAAEYPATPPDFAHPSDPHSPLYSVEGGTSNRPMLVIYAEFNDLTFANTSPAGLDASYMADRFFGSFPSVADYFAEDSYGNLEFTAAQESDDSNNGAANDGIVSVSIDMDKSDFLTLGRSAEQKALLEAADPFVDYSDFDADGNGRITQDELVVHRQDVDPDPAGPDGCATARRPDSVELDGVQLGGGTNLLMVNGGTDTNLMTLTHETGHAAFDMPDLYFWNVGSFDLAGPTCGIAETSLFRTNAWQKTHLGWLEPAVVTSDGYYEVNLTADTGDAFVLYDPDKGEDDYFIVANRARTNGTYDQGASDSGLVIWRLEDDEYTPNGAGEAELGSDGGFISLIRPSGDQAWDPSDPKTPERTMSEDWRDKTPSNVAVRAVPAASPSMRVFFDVRGPGVLVDPMTPQGTPIRVDVTPEEENQPAVTVMNTGEQSDTFRFDYSGLPDGWASVVEEQTLDEHQQADAQPVLIPAADAPTGVHEVTVTGRSVDDAGVTSHAPFEVNVVLDRTDIEYTGQDWAPTGETVELSARVTNPDDATTPPVEGVEVVFEISGDGGSQSATATTGSDGIATAAPTLDLPPGDYQLTAATERHGKHAPAAHTVALRVPTASERIEKLKDDIDQADVASGVERSLLAKLDRALQGLDDGRTNSSCNVLRAFAQEVSGLSGRQIEATTADSFIDDAQGVRSQLDC